MVREIPLVYRMDCWWLRHSVSGKGKAPPMERLSLWVPPSVLAMVRERVAS
jgi:hypothetical protein